MSSSSDSHRTDRIIRGAGRTIEVSPVRVAPAPSPVPPAESASARAPSVAEMIEEARREGFEEGRRAGAAAARSSAEATRAAATRRLAMKLEQAANQVASLRSEVVEEVVGDLSGLVTDVAELLIGRELMLGATAAREAIVRALALAPRGYELVVHVHPDCELDDDEVVAAAAGSKVTIERDPDVDVHGCRVTAGGCDIDAQIPSALARVRSALDELLPTLAAATREELEAQLPSGMDAELVADGPAGARGDGAATTAPGGGAATTAPAAGTSPAAETSPAGDATAPDAVREGGR